MSNKVFVGNLSFDSTPESLRAAFEGDGRVVTNVSIVLDRDTGRSRGFAFVEMGSDEDAQAAITALDGHDLDGRQIRVSEARERDDRGSRRPPGNRRPAGGGGGGGGGGGDRRPRGEGRPPRRDFGDRPFSPEDAPFPGKDAGRGRRRNDRNRGGNNTNTRRRRRDDEDSDW